VDFLLESSKLEGNNFAACGDPTFLNREEKHEAFSKLPKAKTIISNKYGIKLLEKDLFKRMETDEWKQSPTTYKYLKLSRHSLESERKSS